jgi:hypothetical protein
LEHPRPHNSLWIINDRGQLVDRYDKGYLSHSEISGFYTPGFVRTAPQYGETQHRSHDDLTARQRQRLDRDH